MAPVAVIQTWQIRRDAAGLRFIQRILVLARFGKTIAPIEC
jgi:hypothetical protein